MIVKLVLILASQIAQIWEISVYEITYFSVACPTEATSYFIVASAYLSTYTKIGKQKHCIC